MASNHDDVVNALVAQGFSVPQAEDAWSHVGTGRQAQLQAAQHDAAEYLREHGITPPVPTSTTTPTDRALTQAQQARTTVAPGGGPLANVMGQAQAAARAAQQSQTSFAGQTVMGMNADDLFNWVVDAKTAQYTGEEPMPTTTKSAYNVPNADTGVMKIPTVKDQTVALFKMSPDQLSRFQQKLLEGGYYTTDSNGNPARPKWGIPDQATIDAFGNLIHDAMFHPGVGMNELIDNARTSNLTDFVTKRQDRINRTTEQALTNGQITNEATLTNTDTLLSAAESAATGAIGRDFTAAEKKDFIERYHADERTHAQRAYDAIVARTRATVQGVSDQEVDRFLNAVQNGDGTGKFVGVPGANGLGMSPGDWSMWASKVGLPANAPDTPENEKLVGKEIVLWMYDQFGNWQDVAHAWFSGPGKDTAWAPANMRPSSTVTGGLTQAAAGTDINSKVDVVTRAMRSGSTATDQALTGSTVDGSVSSPLNFTEGQASPTDAAQMYAEREHPVEYVGHTAAQRAKDFFDFMTTPTVNVQAQN